MSPPDKDLMTRLTELVHEHGHQWKQIAPILAAEGYRDAKGGPYSDNYLRKRMKSRETAASGISSKPSEDSQRRNSEPVKPSEQPVLDIPQLACAVISILKEEGSLESAVQDVLGDLERTKLDPACEMPPQPVRVTDRRWEKLAGTCDCDLAKLFHEKRRDLRLSVSQMLDYVLWNFFEKPQLSFQSKASEGFEEAGEESHVRPS
ncbi:MAG: hypothetical protein HY912_14715 [Desulfomonile tiedjei]|uniref:Uncharacterized protein n=1 Tax=Desulfomonile tiedjei TaxID=2358 RepID=A0A9D6Z4B0_9BACT|nr:hypothetical protein [Desulfomonile tiedjei]